MFSAYRNKWAKVPVAAKDFIFRALIILVAWKILYLAFLLPGRVLDKPLSDSVAGSTVWILNSISHSSDFSSKSEVSNVYADNGSLTPMPVATIYFRQKLVVNIEDGCNGLELFILYAGFIVCMPALMKRKVIFIAAGVILIYLVNVLRCAGITYIILYHPRYADFAHHYIFTFIVYGFIIGLWLIFSKKLTLVNAETEQ